MGRKYVHCTVSKATEIFKKWLDECDMDDFCASFDHTFGTYSTLNTENKTITILPDKEYGSILEEF